MSQQAWPTGLALLEFSHWATRVLGHNVSDEFYPIFLWKKKTKPKNIKRVFKSEQHLNLTLHWRSVFFFFLITAKSLFDLWELGSRMQRRHKHRHTGSVRRRKTFSSVFIHWQALLLVSQRRRSATDRAAASLPVSAWLAWNWMSSPSTIIYWNHTRCQSNLRTCAVVTQRGRHITQQHSKAFRGLLDADVCFQGGLSVVWDSFAPSFLGFFLCEPAGFGNLAAGVRLEGEAEHWVGSCLRSDSVRDYIIWSLMLAWACCPNLDY